MTIRIKTLIFSLVLASTQAVRSRVSPITIKHEVGLANSLLKRSSTNFGWDFSGSVECQSVHRISIDHFEGSGVCLAADYSKKSPLPFQEQLACRGPRGYLSFDDQFLSTFRHIFSQPYVTKAVFLKWTDPDERVIQSLTDHPDEVMAEVDDPSGRKIEIQFLVNRDYFSHPKLIFKLYRPANRRSKISKSFLLEVLQHICGFPLPEEEVRPIMTWLTQKASNSWASFELHPSVVSDWIVARNIFRFQNMKGVTIKKWVEPKTGLSFKLVEAKSNHRFLVAWSVRRRRFALALLPSLVAGQQGYVIIGSKWTKKPILVSEAKIAEYLGTLGGIAFPINPIIQIGNHLAQHGVLQYFMIYVPLDIEMRIAQLLISK